jgi:perosamine synthetase
MSKPSIGNAELKLVAKVFESGWLGEGNYTELFEQEIARFTGAKHVVAVNTGTSALHLALHAFGIGQGDEVILPSFTFVSDAQAVIMCRAKPVFCEIDEETLNADPSKIKPLITKRTKAIMPTDFAGLPCDMLAIRRLVGSWNIKLIRDASHSFASMDDGKVVGLSSGEDATCFSFDPIKNITCGEGGAILIKDSSIAEKLTSQKMLGIVRSTWHSFSQKKSEDRRAVQEGFRYHMSNINAAIGLAQLARLKTIIRKKQNLAKLYDALFAKNAKIKFFKRDYDKIVPFMYVIRVAAQDRNKLITHLVQNGIHAGLRYLPCHLHPFFSKTKTRLPVTEQITQEILSIPLHCELTVKQVKKIVSVINSYYE